ncbi:MAG: ECF-type sigma factor [Phycisphaerales bacterium]
MRGLISVTDLLSNAQPGDARSMAALLPLVYEELRKLASGYLDRHGASSGRSHTLQPTALVHEAFLKMVGDDKQWSARDHFMAVAATAMRQVLVDHSRRKNEKRGGGDTARQRADISVEGLSADGGQGASREMRVVELDDLLTELARSSERAARVAELRLFGGMEQDQMARVLGVSRMTVHRDWLVARAWLAAKMQNGSDA